MPVDADLLPCPFCGEKAVMTNVRESGHSFAIGCVNEACFRPRTAYYDQKDAVTALWNARPPQGEAWQPIATAPKDGTWVLLDWSDETGRQIKPAVGFYHSTHRRWSDIHSLLHGVSEDQFPTYWMSLQRAPQPQENK